MYGENDIKQLVD